MGIVEVTQADVTQADKDAVTRFHNIQMKRIMAGDKTLGDNRDVIEQAFAAHRITALTAAPASPVPGFGAGGAEAMARLFHETYERLAPSFGYTTRPETRSFDPHAPNGRLMLAVCQEVLNAAPAAPSSGWKTIERAPKDGTRIIGRGFDWGNPKDRVHLREAVWDSEHHEWVNAHDPDATCSYLVEWIAAPSEDKPC